MAPKPLTLKLILSKDCCPLPFRRSRPKEASILDGYRTVGKYPPTEGRN